MPVSIIFNLLYELIVEITEHSTAPLLSWLWGRGYVLLLGVANFWDYREIEFFFHSLVMISLVRL